MQRPISSLALILALAACGGGGGGSPSPPAPPPSFNISGTVSGLQGPDLTLGFNGSANIILHANGLFTGPQFVRGTAYTVVVLGQPTSPWQTCTVTNGTGTLNAPVNNVAINCTTNNYNLSFTVTGLTGANFALQLNSGAAVSVTQDGAFGFTDLPSGTNYTLAITTQPDGQVCTIVNPTGQVAGAHISNVSITCTTEAFSSMVRDLTTLDLAYNPASGELYVSTDTPATGPAIAVIDPLTGNTLRTVPTPQRTSPLAVSEDGQFLYAGLGATGNIRRFALPALTTNLDFSIGTDSTGQPLEPYDIRVAPGNPRTVAVTRHYSPTVSAGYGLAVFDDGVKRADSIGDSTPVAGVPPDGALWSPDGTKIYSLSLGTTTPRYYQSTVSASGVTLQDEIPLPQERSFGFGVIDGHFANRNYQMAGDLLYSSTGTVFDPARRAQMGAFRTRGQGFAIDTARNKAFFASGGFLLPMTFESFDLARMTPIAAHQVPFAGNGTGLGLVHKLVRWGTNGLAAITSTNKLVLVRGTFVSDPTGAISLPPGTLVESTGNAGAYQYRVYNLPAHDVLWDSARERLYASVSGEHRAFGNSIASINVTTDRVVAGAAAGSEPTWMSASDDGTRLYVTHYASSSVVRIDLSTMLLNTVFLLNYPGQGPGYALAAEARPGDASSFAYIEHYPAVSTVFTRMISNLTLRPLSFDEPISTMAFVNADTLFGNNTWGSTLDLHEIGVVPTGLQLVRSDANIFNGQPRMTCAGGLLYGDGGFSIDPVTRNIVHTYNPGMGGTPRAFRANPTRDRGYLAFEDAGSVPHLLVFRLSDEALLTTVPLPVDLQSPISLASMGANGVAITTTAGKTVIVQGPDL